MPKLLDFLTFKETDRDQKERRLDDARPEGERDTDVLPEGFPPDAADIESLSEYRLASLMQYPHY